VRLPGLVMVGDYMFDATLNGVMDSADAATDIIVADLLRRRRNQVPKAGTAAPDHLQHLLALGSLQDVAHEAWRTGRKAKVLYLGPKPERWVEALEGLGFTAMGSELAAPDEQARKFLPYQDKSFDFVIETGLCCLPPDFVARAIGEIRRVTRRGLITASVVTDLSIDLIERFDLLEGVQALCSRWDWSEKLYDQGFRHALFDPGRLQAAWKSVEAESEGPLQWYGDAESLLYSVYELTEEHQVPVKVAAYDHQKAVVVVGTEVAVE
jgi:SAM-dependent methyltransferase